MLNFPRVLYYLGSGIQRLHWSKVKLRKYQNKRVRQVVRNAYDFVPFYHRILKDYGISPQQIRTVDDLSKLPLIQKNELRKNNSELISKNYAFANLKFLQTSGSSGQPLKIYVNESEADWRRAIYMRANVACGQKPRDVWAFITAPRHFGDTPKIQRQLGLFAQQLVSVYGDPSKNLQILKKMHPDILDGYSGAMFLVAKEAKLGGIEDLNLRLMFGSVDSLDVSQYRFMEKVFNAPYLDQYGCSEVNRMAWQCPCKEGYHVDADSVIIEIVDSEGNPVGNNETGEIVITSLYNFAMPFIRYCVGDLGVSLEDSCSCGINLPLIKSIEGRKDSFVTLPDGRLLSPRVFTVGMSSFKFYSCIEQFRVVQKKCSLFEIFLKMNDSSLDYGVVEKELISHLFNILNVGLNDLEFNVRFVDEIPLIRGGKRMSVISEVPPA